MKHRSPLAVFFLPFVTFGIYSIVWEVKTKNEMVSLGSEIPTAWLLIIPFANYYWLWKYCEGVEKITNGETSAVLAFVLLFLLGVIGMAILQNEFNKIVGQPQFAGAPAGDPTVQVGGPTGFAPPTPEAFAPGPAPAGPQPMIPPQPIVNPEPPIGAPQSPVAPGGPVVGSDVAPDQNGGAPLPPQSPPLV